MMRTAAALLLTSLPALAGFGYQRAVTIDHTKVGAADSANFTVLISGTYPWLATAANGGRVQSTQGFDIVFTSDAAGLNPLSWELSQYTGASGKVNIWVRVPNVSHTVDTTIHMFYGNPAIAAFQGGGSAGAWDANHVSVWHMNDNAANTTVTDSMGANNLVNAANTAGRSVAGVVAGALSYDGSTDNSTKSSATTVPFPMTISGLFYRTADQVFQTVFSHDSGGHDGYNVAFETDAANDMNFVLAGVQAYDTGLPTVKNTWYYYAISCTAQSGACTAYLGPVGGTLSSTTFSIGAYIGTPSVMRLAAESRGFIFNGNLDEHFLSKVARPTAWITAQFNNLNSPGTFYSLGAEIVNSRGSSLGFVF